MRRFWWALALAACTRAVPTSATDPLAPLRSFEGAARAKADFATTPLQDHAFGADPYRLVAYRGGVAGILRGGNALVVLDASLKELSRTATPRSPTAIAEYRGDLFVTSELEPVLARYAKDGKRTDIPLGDVVGARDVAIGPEGVAYVVEEHDDRLVVVDLASPGNVVMTKKLARGPMRVVRTGDALVVLSVLDHSLTVFPVDARGMPGEARASTRIDGPYWGLAADAGYVVAGGIEDHPLDRREGFFGYVDSFVYVYRLPALERVFAINVGEHGLIVPKAIGIDRGTALVTSYGSEAAVRVALDTGTVSRTLARPGLSALVAVGDDAFVGADPLLDAWVRIAPSGVTVRAEGHDDRSQRVRLGEAIFFTRIMAPEQSAEGAHSRFTCETCHFEGYTDGRTHHTGRGDVHATTKPLVGLFNNRPHFSRALDPDLSSVAENEFRVAGAPAGNPHFTLRPSEVPWLHDLGVNEDVGDAELRLSLMAFLMSWTHRTNPRAATPRSFTDEERAGAIAFRDRCEGCHEARLSADVPSSRVPFGRWQAMIFDGGPIVWASDAYAKTGIEPYVHENGARVPSLRRLYKKSPYFTNGSAPDLARVMKSARVTGGRFLHSSAEGTPIDDATAKALVAFVDLL